MSESGTEIVLTTNKIHVHAKETLPLCLFIFRGRGGDMENESSIKLP